MRRIISRIAAAVLIVSSLVIVGCTSATSSSSQEPVKVSVWTYYNGGQLAAFQELVNTFNATVGAEKGIIVEGSSVGSVEDLRDAVMNSATGKIGAEDLPNVFMTYADTAYAIDQMGLLVDIAQHLTAEERDAYVTGYLEEGTLGDEHSIKIFPVAKSVELLVLSKTDFDPFAAATGASYDDLATFEGITQTAQAYYEWTDAQTPEPNDGKAFFGRDSLANYFFIGAKQLGTTIVVADGDKVTLDLNKDTMRTLWDNYYVPFVKGHFFAKAQYRSDDVKTGDIIALVGSSSGATFFPDRIVAEDGSERDIEKIVLPCPRFAAGDTVAVQQGAGMAIIEASQAEVDASIEFLKWFSSPDQNIQFSVSSGYLPVMKAASNMEAIRSHTPEIDATMEAILAVALEESNNELFTPHAFANGTALRNLFEYSFADFAARDAAAVQAALAEGASYDEALAPYLQPEYFDTWYEQMKAEAEALIP